MRLRPDVPRRLFAPHPLLKKGYATGHLERNAGEGLVRRMGWRSPLKRGVGGPGRPLGSSGGGGSEEGPSLRFQTMCHSTAPMTSGPKANAKATAWSNQFMKSTRKMSLSQQPLMRENLCPSAYY